MSEAMRALARPDAADVVADELIALADGGAMSELPLAGRRLYFVGIGGAGLSAYANFARAWGAEVRGWDVRETIFLEALDGVEVDLGGEPAPPEGFEVVVSTAHAGRIEGRSRAEFLAELVSLRRSIVVGGAHGKTTTAAMVAYVLRELGHDPAWIIGGVVPQLGGNAGAGEGWLVVEGDESDRSIALLRPEIAVVTNVELDHHATYASEAELAAFFDEWLAARAARSCAAGSSSRSTSRSPCRASTTAQRRGGARRARARGGRIATTRERAIAAFAGVGRRFELVGERGGVRVIDDYGHNPTEIAAALATARELEPRALIAVYQPHVYERTRQLHHELGRRSASPTPRSSRT